MFLETWETVLLYSVQTLNSHLVLSISVWGILQGPSQTQNEMQAYNKDEMYLLYVTETGPPSTHRFLHEFWGCGILEIYCVLLSLINIIYCILSQCSLCIQSYCTVCILSQGSTNTIKQSVNKCHNVTGVPSGCSNIQNPAWKSMARDIWGCSSTGTFTVHPLQGLIFIKNNRYQLFLLVIKIFPETFYHAFIM